MPFDDKTRNLLSRLVGDARRMLVAEFTAQLQELYGIQPDGAVVGLAALTHLDDEQIATASRLRERIDHLASGFAGEIKPVAAAIDRALREQAFTVLNRFAALRMCEERGLLQECVADGFNSKGFKVYQQVAGSGLGDTYHRYRAFIGVLFDELALDLGILFDRYSSFALLFPREQSLLGLLELLNQSELKHIWAEDETIGWVYQYFNPAEERKAMRDASGAPRNSRELAVRNQFFTPRYVVEFLSDNTLGRIWYEMTKGDTRLKDTCRYLVRRLNEVFLAPDQQHPLGSSFPDPLSQEELFRQIVYIPHRPIKDPRTIRMIDPACGSMHFGLYCFDLYEVIYEEAWVIEERIGPQALLRESEMSSLHESFSSKEDFLRQVPRLIIQHNIHGIDIDPRCAQIAGLSLWLRAQRSWQRQRVKPGDRPRVTKSNIVCAEPMPGSKELLREFTATLPHKAIAQLVEMIFDKMQLAGEAGSLLKIEEEIRDIVAEAKRQWEVRPKTEQTLLFSESSKPKQIDLQIDTSGTTDEQFWDKAEENIYMALAQYAETVQNGHSLPRRLFAEDAAHGFAFIDLCRKHYDVALMNPPFGDSALAAKTYIEKSAGPAKADIYTAFLARWCALLSMGGRLGAITPRSFIYQIDFHEFRKNYLFKQGGMPLLAELGFGELDGASNRTAAFLLVPSNSCSDLTLYSSLSDEGCKADKLHAVFSSFTTSDLRCGRIIDFDVDASSQLLFRLSSSFRNLLQKLPKLDPVLGKAHKGKRNGVCNIVNGLQCPTDFRYVRLAVEVPTSQLGVRWQLFLKPLVFAPYVSELSCVVNWNSAGAEQKAEYDTAGISPSKYISGEEFYPSSGVWFPDVSERGIGAALIPFTAIPGRKGLLALGKSERDIPSDALAGYLNSIVAEGILGLITPERHHKPSYMGQIPWLLDETIVQASAEHYWKMCSFASVEAPSELGDSFIVPTILLRSKSGLRDAIRTVVNDCKEAVLQMEKEQTSFDELILRRLGASLTDSDLLEEMSKRARINSWFPTNFSLSEHTDCKLVGELVSYMFGCAFGRWNIFSGSQVGGNAQRLSKQNSLARCPPGQLQNPKGLPACQSDVPKKYPIIIPWDGILVDEANHLRDVERSIRDVIEFIWSNHADAIEREACEILGVKSLRDFFRNHGGFFADHIKRYSKSRRQAPIYWPLSTTSGSYTLWIYYHRLTDQTLYVCVKDFVDPKIAGVGKDINRVRTELKDGGGEKKQEQLEELVRLEQELRDFRDELMRVAKLPYKPDLNDGVIISACPLWKLFRLPRWQKDLKACWESLSEGTYDWAHLAYSIWPDRVTEKCKTDRSLAIAHDLEHLCTVESTMSKMKKKVKKSIRESGESQLEADI